MTANSTDSGRGLYSRLPDSVKLGLVLIGFVYAVAILTNTINDPLPSDVWAAVWFAVAIALLMRTVRLARRS